MLYVPSAESPRWIGFGLLGSRTGIRTAPYQAAPNGRSSGVQPGASTSSLLVDQSEKLSQVQRVYESRDEARVTGFLRANPVLIDLLLEALEHLERCCGPAPQVVLEVVADPDTEDSEELFANIVTSLPVDEALEQLNYFDDTWFLAQLGRTEGRFNFNLEFV